MKLKVNTKKLQGLVSKAMKCASCVADIPLTSMIALELKEGTLTVTTTDENTYLYLSEPCEGEDFYVVVDVGIFSKLVSKITSEEVTLTVNDGTLEVVGNGKYMLELPYNGEGELVKFPDPRSKAEGEEEKVSLSTLKMIYATGEASLDKTKGYHGCYTGYYMGKKVITTDSFKVCIVDTPIFNTPVILRPETMELIDMLSGEEIKVTKNDKYILFTSDRCSIFSQLLPYLEDFQVDAIEQVADFECNNSCYVDKAVLLGVLDRLSLFVSKMDENGIRLTFTCSGLDIESRQADGVEVVDYSDAIDLTTPFTCELDITRFADQVKSVIADNINICFGHDGVIKIIDGNIKKVVALFSQE